MSSGFTAFSTNDLKLALLKLGFVPGFVISDGSAIEYSHPTKTRNFSKNNLIFLPVSNVINKRYADKLLDDLLSFDFSHDEIVKACLK